MTTRNFAVNVALLGLFGLIALPALLLAGCEPTTPPRPPARTLTPAEFFSDPGPAEPRPEGTLQLPGYRLNFADELEIIYQIRHDITPEDYRLEIEDKLDIRFPFQPELNQVLQIPSDGKINLLLIKDPILAYGKTARQLKAELLGYYAKLIQNPEFTVVIEQANAKVAELKLAITTSPRGQSRLVPIGPDGRLSLPYVPSVLAYGLTVPELIDKLNEEYRKAGIEGIEVSANLLNIAPVKVYILGEVSHPGLVTLTHHSTLMHALTSAGGLLRGRADETKVLLLRRRGLPAPSGTVVNVHYLTEGLGLQAGDNQTVDFAALRFDPFMQDDDIIYVPSTQLAKNSDWIKVVFTEGIYRVIPWSSTVTYNMNDSVKWLGK